MKTQVVCCVGLLLLTCAAAVETGQDASNSRLLKLLESYLGGQDDGGIQKRHVDDDEDHGSGDGSADAMGRMIDCRGMPCDAWARTQANMKKVFEEIYSTKLPDQGSFDLMNHEHDNPDGTFDGCTWLTEAQSEALMLAMSDPRRIRRRANRVKRKLNNFVLQAFNKWDTKEPIPWKFDGEHTSDEQKTIRAAFQSWMDETCVRFEEKGLNDLVYNPHILVTRRLTGCHSYVGRVSLTPQILNLQGSCVTEFGIPVHEIGHALGLWHEQQRSDRDSTIRVLWSNLGYYMGQFAAIDTLNLNVPYDVGSVMHYAPKDGSSNGGNVMETLDPLYQKSMGQKTGMSYYDALIINKAYCSEVCNGRPLAQPCEREGYQNPNNCNVCKCPPGFGGDFCETTAAPKGENCGGVIDLTTSAQTIMTPGYDWPGYYNVDQECNWLIKAPADHRVVLKFTGHFSVYSHTQGQCYHWVEIKYKGSFGLPGPRFCGYSRPQEELVSSGQEMMIVFRSNWTVAWGTARGGFKAEIRAERALIQDIPDVGEVESTTTKASTTTTTTTTRPAESTTPKSTTTMGPMLSEDWTWECDFDSGNTWCDMQQDSGDNFDWTLGKGETPSKYTGPSKAYNGDYYVFIEATHKNSGDRALLWTPTLNRYGSHCIMFYYHMYGHHINTLRVVKGISGNYVTVWQKQGEQDQNWHRAEINVSLDTGDKVGFEAVRGDEYSGDISIDNIMILPGSC